MTVCPMVQANPSTSICMFPTLCTGGCKIACQKPTVLPDNTLVANLVQQSFQLTWEVQQKVTENVVFVLAGRDRVGMMNELFSDITENKVVLTEEMTTKFVEITVLAVNSNQVVDKATIEMTPAQCSDNDRNHEENHPDERDESRFSQVSQKTTTSRTFMLYLVSLVILVVILLILIVIIFLKDRNNDDRVSTKDDDDLVGKMVKDAFLPSSGDFDFVEIDNTEQLYKFF